MRGNHDREHCRYTVVLQGELYIAHKMLLAGQGYLVVRSLLLKLDWSAYNFEAEFPSGLSDEVTVVRVATYWSSGPKKANCNSSAII